MTAKLREEKLSGIPDATGAGPKSGLEGTTPGRRTPSVVRGPPLWGLVVLLLVTSYSTPSAADSTTYLCDQNAWIESPLFFAVVPGVLPAIANAGYGINGARAPLGWRLAGYVAAAVSVAFGAAGGLVAFSCDSPVPAVGIVTSHAAIAAGDIILAYWAGSAPPTQVSLVASPLIVRGVTDGLALGPALRGRF